MASLINDASAKVSFPWIPIGSLNLWTPFWTCFLSFHRHIDFPLENRIEVEPCCHTNELNEWCPRVCRTLLDKDKITMNNFDGIIQEYGNIAVDCFDGPSLKATAFFLSHCHSDHMKGLSSLLFHERIKFSNDIKLYCSRVTLDLLVGDNRFKHLKSLTTVLEIEEPITLNIPAQSPDHQTTQVVVTLLPAGHCPGSVMFLFEGHGGTVLYTGDFRLSKDDLQKKTGAYGNLDRIKRLDKLYIDTTFCTRDAMKLPLRRESRDALFEILDPWLAEASNHMVFLSCPAQFGCEYLFVELNRRYNMKVHVYKRKMWQFAAIPEIMESVTLKMMSTRLHACGYKRLKSDGDPDYGRWLPCECYKKQKRRNILSVRFSTMWFTSSGNASDGLVHKYSDNSYRVCYSMHASCEEICDFVHHWKPRSLHPLVIPLGSTLEQVHQILRLDSAQPSSMESLAEKKFGSLQNDTLIPSGTGSGDSDLIFHSDSQLRSPVMKRSKTFSSHETSNPMPSHHLSSSQEFDFSPAKPQVGKLVIPPVLQDEVPKWSFEISPCKELSSSQETSCSMEQGPGKLTRRMQATPGPASSSQEFDFSPAKPKGSKSERPPALNDEVPKWTFEISPCRELTSSQETSCSEVQDSGKLKRRMRVSSGLASQDSPSTESNCSLSSSQESRNSGCKSLGGYGACKGSSVGLTPPKHADSEQTPFRDVSLVNRARVDLMSRLEPTECPVRDILTVELSSSSVEVIDLTDDADEAAIDWDSTPELDDILKLEETRTRK